MKKVVYSIRKVRDNSDYKISGLGFLNDEGTLFCKTVNVIRERLMTSENTATKFSAKKTNTAVT